MKSLELKHLVSGIRLPEVMRQGAHGEAVHHRHLRGLRPTAFAASITAEY